MLWTWIPGGCSEPMALGWKPSSYFWLSTWAGSGELVLGGLLSSTPSLAPCWCFHRASGMPTGRDAVCSASWCGATCSSSGRVGGIAPSSRGSQKCWDVKTHPRNTTASPSPHTHFCSSRWKARQEVSYIGTSDFLWFLWEPPGLSLPSTSPMETCHKWLACLIPLQWSTVGYPNIFSLALLACHRWLDIPGGRMNEQNESHAKPHSLTLCIVISASWVYSSWEGWESVCGAKAGASL